MKLSTSNEHGNTSPGITLAILIILGIVAFLAFDSMDPNDPSTMSLSSMYTTWLGWSWWAKGLSIGGPIGIFMIGKLMDGDQGFTKL
jgi:hypothetical protein